MKNQFIVTEVEVHQNQILCYYTIQGNTSWHNCFPKEYSCLEVTYSQSIGDVPKGVAVIPLLCDVLPIVWLMDAEIVVDELDQSFYNSIAGFKNGYIKMYPELKFGGLVTAKKLISYTYNTEKSAVLFSGGVDAFNTLFSNMAEHPALITLWGADIACDNEEGWKPVQQQVEETAAKFDLSYYIVRTNFRKIISEATMTNFVQEKNHALGWWHDFQHGIGIISHVAPIAYQYGIGKVYIASSFTAADTYTCASDPTIDNFVRFGNTVVIHDGYEYNRQMKIHNICSYTEEHHVTAPLRVCWKSTTGRNCCTCEKCYRTMMGVLAEGKDPQKLGFTKYDATVRKNMLHDLRYGLISKYNKRRYCYIQQRLREVYTRKNCPNDLKWFYRLKFEDTMPHWEKFWLRCRRKWKRMFGRVGE